jgi:flagellar hook-associated protein 2
VSTSSTTSSSTIFNGNSRYSQDFQAVIDRTVAIASLPISQLNAQKTALSDQTTAMTGLDGKFNALQSALDKVTAAVGGSSFDASVSDTSKLSVTLGDGAQEGNYSVEVVDPGAYASTLSAATWVAAPGAPHAYSISISGVQHQVFAQDNTAAGVASAINTQFGDQVRAIVVNVGSAQTPDYRLSLQATQLGNLAPDLLDGGSSLQTQQTTGTLAQYIVNGSGNTVTSSTRSVSIANGVTVSLQAASTGPVNITVTRSTSALSSALDAFATAYNAAVDEVDKQHGNSSGALAGQSLVGGLSNILSDISTYDQPGSGIGGLGGLGLDLDKTGHLTFNSFKLLATDLTNSTGVTAFLGSTTGGGFLKLATDSLQSVEGPGTGLLPSAEANVTEQSSHIDATIADSQARVDQMKTQLQAQMAASDALIATMEQQYNYLTGLFQSQQAADRMYG